MKMDRKGKADQVLTKTKTSKGSRRTGSKSTPGNGKHPPVTYEHAPIGIVEASLEGHYININEEFCRMMGYEKEELLRRSLKDFTHEDDYSIDVTLHEKLVAGKIPFYRLEKRYIRKDGGSIWVELTRSLVSNDKGTPLYTVGVVLDISDRKDVERVLRESVERLRLATEAAQMFMWEWDVQHRSYTLADNFEQVLGFSADLLPKNHLETVGRLIPEEDVQHMAQAYEKAIGSRSDLHSLDCRVINPDNGQIVWLEVSGKIVYDDQGNVVRMFGVAQNITENKKAEAALQLARRQAEQSADRTGRLQKVTAALSEALTPPQVAEVLATQGAPGLGAASSSMMLLSEDSQSLELMYSTTAESVVRPYKRFPVSLKVPAADAIRSGELIWIESRQQYLQRYPHLADQINLWGQQAAIAIPMAYEGRILGVLTLSFDQVLAYNMEDREYFLTLARQGAQALDRARAEDALRESEERFRALVSQATAGITQADLSGRLTFVNQKLAEMLDYGESELIGKTLEELTYAEDWVENQRSFEQLAREGTPFEVEQRLLRRNGSAIWASVSMSPLLDAHGKMQSSIAVVLDITERKLAEEWERLSAANLLAAAEANAKFRTFFDQGSYFAGVMTLDGTLIEANRLCLEFCGFTREDVIGKKFWDCGWWNPSPELMDMVRRGTQEAAAGRIFRQESTYFIADGSQRYVDLIIAPVWDENGRLLFLAPTGTDITERKRMEDAIRESEERFRALVSQATAGITETDMTGTLTFVNPTFCQMLGYLESELLGRSIWGFTHTHDLEENKRLFERMISQGESFQLEKRLIRRDGSPLWASVSVSTIRDLNGESKGGVGVILDINERKRGEAALSEFAREQEALYKFVDQLHRTLSFEGIYDAALDAILSALQCDRASILLFDDSNVMRFVAWRGLSAAYRKATEGHSPWSPDEKNPAPISMNDVEIAELSESLRAVIRQEGIGSLAFIPLVSTGRLIGKLMLYYNAPHRFSEKELDLALTLARQLAFGIDRKRAEENLRESEERYRFIVENTSDGIWWIELTEPMPILLPEDEQIDWYYRHAVIRQCNLGLARMYGYASPEEIVGLPLRTVMPRENLVNLELSRQFIRSGYRLVDAESREVSEDGRELVFLNNMVGIIEDGKLKGEWGTNRDITERKRAEEALRQSEERFARFMQHLPGLAWIKDVQGRYVYANAAAEKAFSTPREKLYGKTDQDIFPPDVAAQFKKNDEQALLVEDGVQVIETLQHEDNVLHHSLVTKFLIPGPDGKTTLIGGTAFDITERLRAEEALRESEERFRAILRQATAGIVRKDAEGRLIFVNQAFCNMLGYTESELLGKTMWELMHEDDLEKNRQSYHRLMMEGIPFKLERRLIREDGSVIWVDASVSPIMDAQGKPQSAVAVEVDITGRKQAEAALQQLNLQLEERVLSRTAKLRAANQTLRDEIAERKKVEEALRRSEAIAHENEAKLRSLFELLPVGISFLDLEGRVIQMNSALLNILKLSKEEFLSQEYKSRKYIRADGTPMPPTEFASARAVAEQRTIYNVETGVVLDTGAMIWTSVSAAPVDVADVSVVVVTVDITDSKRAEQALQESHARLRILSQRLVEVQEEERRALARELHDRVGQTLAALNINLIIINSQLSGDVAEQIGTRLNDSMKLVAETIALVRDVMTDLRPAVLDDYGLEAALESHLSQFIARYGINAKFEEPAQPIPRLGPSVEMTCLRIAQEALMNIARHAQATQVTLSLRQDEEEICMTIQDNGIGIQSWQDANRPGSHGLTIMRERAAAFGGNLHVRSMAGQGTTIEVIIPLKGQKQAQQEPPS